MSRTLACRGLGALAFAALGALVGASGPGGGSAAAQEAVVHQWHRVYYAPLDGTESLLFGERFARAKPAVADLDGDGDPDLLLGTAAGRLMYFENRGNAQQPDWRLVNAAISARTEPGARSAARPIDVGDNAAPALVDIDGDGDLDLFVGDASGAVHFFRNEGNRYLPNFRRVTEDFLGRRLGLNLVVKFPDVNGDGLPDLSLGNEAGAYYLALNAGSRADPRYCLQAQASPECLAPLQKLGALDPEDNAVPEWTDWDRDGDLDLFVGKSDGSVAYLQNIGTPQEGAWELAEGRFNILDIGGFAAPVFADLTGDGEADLLLAGDGEALAWYSRRLRERQFTLWLEGKNALNVRRLGGHATRIHIAGGDLDGDGDLDLVVGTRAGALLLYENVGTPEVPAFRSPEGRLLPTPQRAFAAPALADVDGDGDLDLIVGGREGRLEWIENTGTPQRPRWSARSLFFGEVDAGGLSVPLFAELDGDGDLDLVVGNSVGSVVFYENVGTAQKPDYALRSVRMGGLQVPRNAAPALFAWSAEGPPELVLGNQAGTLVPAPRNPAVPVAEGGAFRREPPWGGGLRAETYSAPFFSDLTGDGRPDLLLGTGPGAVLFWRYEGSAPAPQVAAAGAERAPGANVVEEAPTSTAPGPAGGPAAEAGAVTAEALPLDPIFVYEASALEQADAGRVTVPAFLDANGDGRPDLLIGTAEGKLLLYRNAGERANPTWELVTERFADYDGGRNAAPTVADVTGDGLPDLAVGTAEGRVLFWENTGTATQPRFAPRHEPFSRVRAGRNAVPAFVDVDEDGRLDLLVGNLKGELLYYRNQAGLSFDLELRRFIGLDVGVNAAPTFAELTQRGRPYLVVGSDGGAVHIYGPTGTSRLRTSGWREHPSWVEGLEMPLGSRPALADIDGDGDLDLVVGSDKGPLYLFRNHARQPPGVAQAPAR